MILKLSALAVAAALVSACGKEEAKAPATATAPAAPAPVAEMVVKLGFAAPLTGPQAHYGKEMQNGVVLAVDEANASKPMFGDKPVRFELMSEDDMADPKTGTSVAQKLVDEGINGMIGHFNSGTSIPASKVYSDAGIPQIAMATSPVYTAQGYKTTFRAMTSDTQQGSVAGKFAVEKLQAKKVAIIDDRTAYGQGLADEFEKAVKAAGGEIVKREFTNDKATDFSAILTNIKGTAPDLIYYGGADAQAGPMVKQIKQLGIEAKFMGGEMVKSPTFVSLGGEAAEGAIASLAGVPLEQMPGGTDYAARYKAKFNSDVEIYSPYAYDATRAMIEAMKQAGSAEPSAYLPKLAAIQFAGITSSNIAYDEKGDLKSGGITLYQVKGGEWTVMETVQ
ncbi:branched-chain amino acid ABC transporter substrate-binding protein [Denitromonas ohlonensis]|uniref:Branched-chain amino acid ABC transporter substrate-binding protein n=3 Tax=Zoogloeaceae TaxID=2008794 RepID=A0A557QDF5_9RHOO|nr:branched-chain amino acid ABC transporter substrate-binding protein [Denitromonas halophila]TVO62954.1 branched-chain amino acid ABC transporter substrate-binding protein [Denitromonas ohlonensis]TVO75075.1 branched-chain amino acid ABC transporter substrate-binding protein [Denitromonas ohlonensis]